MVNTSVKHRGKLQALSSVDGSIFFVSRLALVLSAVWAVIYLGAGKHAISFIAAGVGIGSLISTLLSANEKYASAKHVFFITTFVGVLASTTGSAARVSHQLVPDLHCVWDHFDFWRTSRPWKNDVLCNVGGHWDAFPLCSSAH